jgi:hypothetical protein
MTLPLIYTLKTAKEIDRKYFLTPLKDTTTIKNE